MLYCLRLRAQIVLCSFVVYFALALYFTPPHPLPPFNKAGLLAWVHTYHFHLHVAGWVGPLPHLSFHSLLGGACASLVGSSVTLQGVSLPPLLHYSLLGCVAATLIALLIITKVCCCHPSCLHVAGCVAATPPLGTLSNRRRRPHDGNRKRDISFETTLRMYQTL